ncbi:NACHT domain-containing protein [Nucisporomicrobium flavum]|uniref:NACHT domain-containing protein n=1 Tax=Nucisporomicrobium flavum TaxID=2785915 RepID=UPI003C2B4A0B
MSADAATPDMVEAQVRFALAQLRAANGHHLFEEICRHYAQARLSRMIVPATGPVGAGGDQGRDFESLATGEPGETVVFICTLQVAEVAQKIKNDVAKVMTGAPVDRIYAFCEANVPVAKRHELRRWAETNHQVLLEVIDGRGLAVQLAQPDLRWIVDRFLALPAASESREVHLRRYEEAAYEAARKHPYRLGSRPFQVPSLPDLYQEPVLVEGPSQANPAGPEHPVHLDDFLLRHRHAVLLGPAGAGKSSLLRHLIFEALTKRQTSAPAETLPVGVHARDLCHGKPLAEAIRDGAVAALGTTLTEGLPVALFASEPEPGTRWLVLVDGLDEIHETVGRQQVVEALLDGFRLPFLRFVLATRHLPETELDSLWEYCGGLALRPFGVETTRRYAEERFARHGLEDARTLARRVTAHTAAIGDPELNRTPLVVAMLCTLVADDPKHVLPATLSGVYGAYLDLLRRSVPTAATQPQRELQDNAMAVLQTIAHRRLFQDDSLTILDAAVEEFAERSRKAPLTGYGRSRHDVRDALLQTGLLLATTTGSDLVFHHHVLEDLLAVRQHVHLLREDRRNAINDLRYAHILIPGLLTLLAEVWVDVGEDLDSLIGELMADEPDGSVDLISELLDHGLPLGSSTNELLTVIAVDWRRGSRERLLAARTLRRLDTDAGNALLLALSVDADMDDTDRLSALEDLCSSDPTAAAAAGWLLRYDSRAHVHYTAQIYAIFANAGVHQENDDTSLLLLLRNGHLPDRVRAWAASVFLNQGHPEGYAVQMEFLPVDRLLVALGELLGEGHAEAQEMLRRLSRDESLSERDRRSAAELLDTEA